MNAALLPAWQATSGKQCVRRHPAAVPRNQRCACSAQLWPAQQQRQSIKHIQLNSSAQLRRQCVQRGSAVAAAAAADGGGSSSSDGAYADAVLPAGKAIPIRLSATAEQDTYSLKDTKVLVETAMLAAVSGLAFLLSTLLKLDSSLGYFLPLPIAIAACRSGPRAGWDTMGATACLVLVLLGPLRAVTYVLLHGGLAAALGSMWAAGWPWSASVLAGAALRMSGQLGYLLLSSVTMNENLFAVMLANVHNLLDRLSAALGSSGAPSTNSIVCMIFALLLVNGVCYVFLLHVVYNVILGSMGYRLGPLPGFVRRFLYPERSGRDSDGAKS